MKRRTHLCCGLLALTLFCTCASAQVATGSPPFASIGGGPFDSVDLGDLNVHFTVPVISKAGRGMPFTYNLAYDSSIWTPVSVSGINTWQPAANWGWQGQTEVAVGYISETTTVTKLLSCGDGTFASSTLYSWKSYRDSLGVSHGFSPMLTQYNGCAGDDTSNSKLAVDGSGYTLSAVGGSATVIAPNGTVLTPPINTQGGAGSTQDANGNKITVNGSGTFTDTLGTTVLSVSGTNPVTFQYTGPTGSQHYTLSYSPYNVKTNFGCANVPGEYTSTGTVSLVSGVVLPDNSQYQFQYEDTPGNAGYKTGRISQVTLPTGGVIQYSYTYTGSNDGINCTDGSAMVLQRTITPGGLWQYSRSGANTDWATTINDPSNNQTLINFEEYQNNFYETQRLAYQGTTGGTLLSTTINCYNGQNVATPANCYNTPITAQVTRVTNFRYLPDANGIQAETDSTYDNFGLIHEVDDYDYGMTGGLTVGSLIRKTITAYQGGMTNGIVDRPSSVTIEDSGNIVKAFTAYGYDETAVATPSGTTPQWVSISGSRGNLTSVNAQANGSTHLYRKYTYYNTGMLKTSTDVSTSSATNGATTTYNYNNTGTPSPSCGNSFVTSILEPVGSMSRSFTWDCNGGVPLSVVDENGKTSSTAYSGANYTNVFWRPYSKTDEAGTTTDYVYFLNGSTPPVEFQTESKYHATFNNNNSTVDKVITTDAFGRIVFSQTRQSPSSSNYDTVATCYDNFGRTNLTTLPYSTTLAISSTACPSSNSGTSYAYDAFGRTQTVSDSGGGSTTFSYSKNDILETRTSPTVSKQSEFDALGRVKSVCEITTGTGQWPSASCTQNTSATGYLTTYAYDLRGNIASVTQNAQAGSNHQTRSYLYDMLSRLTSETNPENSNTAITYVYDTLSGDPSCGTITSAGNLLKQVDAAGNVGCMAGYDALHRVGSVTYPPSSTPSKHFVYDTATVNGVLMANTKTRLAEAYTCIGGCSSKTTDLGFSYSALGQQSDLWELTPHSGTNYYYHVTSVYWPNGTVNTISNLAGLPTITYGADGEGRMSTVSAGTGQNPVTLVSYNPASQVTGITYGSLDTDAFTFYSTTGRQHTYVFSMGASPNTKTDTGTLSWNSNGSLQQLAIVDQINSLNTQTCNYTHDSLGRVATANCGTSIWNQNFAYDPFGNISKTVPNGSTGTSFNVAYDATNLTNRVITSPYSYTSTSDPNAKTGNMTVDASHAYGWDTANRLSTVDSGTSSGVCVTYDALDRVVEQATGATCTSTYKQIVYSPAGAKLALMNASALSVAFVSLPGGAQAVYNGSGLLYYRHPDWLGSSRLSTTPSRTCYWDSAYAPFGENYAEPSTGCVIKDLSFTGQNQDTETSASGGPGGFYDFMFRRQSPVQGRWLSPDPAGLVAANPSDPQTWNRYAYVGNRSLNATDALGLYQPGCDPVYYYCIPSPCGPDDPYCNGCDPDDPYCSGPPVYGGGGGSGGDGGIGAPSPSPTPPVRRGGVWPDNETLGLPKGLGLNPLSLADLFGLSPNCGDFIACGSLGPGTDSFVDVGCTVACAAGSLQQKLKLFVLIAQLSAEVAWKVFLHQGSTAYDPRKDLPEKMQQLLATCSPGTLCSEPATGGPYAGGTSFEQEYICPAAGVWTVHWIVMPSGKIVHGPHVRPGAPRCDGGGP